MSSRNNVCFACKRGQHQMCIDARNTLCSCNHTVAENDYQPCPDPRCNEHLGASPMPQCVTAVYWQEEAQKIADVLRELSDRFNKIDNGHCTICRQHRLYDTRGNKGPCENVECLSHRIGEILSNYEKPSAAVLDRIRRNCEQQLFGK
jgi:hypothetical protein